jgi:hypothetical protein
MFGAQIRFGLHILISDGSTGNVNTTQMLLRGAVLMMPILLNRQQKCKGVF